MEVNVLHERVTEQEKFNSRGSKRSVQRPSDLKIGSVQRLQDDIRELEKRKENDDTSKNVKKLERKYKEAVMVLEEDRKFLARQQEEYECNQIKARKMKVELEEIEAQYMQFSSKARKLAQDLQDVEEKVEHAETTLNVIWGK